MATAVAKLTEDFDKLQNGWGKISPIRAYSFVFNDKYEGAFTRIGQALQKLATANGIPCVAYTIADMEDDFLRLSPDQMQSVLGQLIPDASRVTSVDFGVLQDVILHIMNIPARAVTTRWGDLPELGEKVQLNNLSEAYAALLNNYARKAGRVDQFFAKNSNFQKQALRDHLIGAYHPVRDRGRAIKMIPDGVSREDLVFAEFRQSLLPVGANVASEDALDILIAYYFESCDVFDPHADPGAANASP